MNKKQFLFFLILGWGAVMLHGQEAMTIDPSGTVMVTTDLEVAGSSILPKIYEVTANRTIEDSELSLTQTTMNVTVGTGNLTLTLPAVAAVNRGKIIEFIQVDDGSGDATVTPNGTDTINGTPSWMLNGQWQRVRLQSDGNGDWKVLDCLGTLLRTVDSTTRTMSGVVESTWYNDSNITLTVTPGTWEVEYFCSFYTAQDAGYEYAITYVTLSNANNTEWDKDLTASGGGRHIGDMMEYNIDSASKKKILTFSSTATLYLNISYIADGTNPADNIVFYNTPAPAVIRARRIS